ncbi:MAG TPA: MoaD/ThiS family protein [Acidimicrobiia bacterium]|nr:MoaD/ThiS family protein [Acidimicrobiia bacterium]
MAQLRLFANLRELAGTSRLDVPSDTVGGVIALASEKFGPDFERGVETARVWLNGESATMEDRVTESDEVVLLPPVSGGDQPAVSLSAVDLKAFLPAAVAVVAVLANTQGQEIWAAVLVLIASIWAVDVGSAFEARGKDFATLAVVVTAAGSAMAAHVAGGDGYALAVVLAVVVGLGWAVAFDRYRKPDVFSPTVLVALLAGLGTASLVLARSAHSPEASAIDVFLVSVIAALALGAVIERMPPIPMFDPFSVTALGAVIAAVVAAWIWDLSIVSYLLVGLGIAVALLAGRGLSSMLRTGRVSLTERAPGTLVSLDGVALAAAVYYPLLLLVL